MLFVEPGMGVQGSAGANSVGFTFADIQAVTLRQHPCQAAAYRQLVALLGIVITQEIVIGVAVTGVLFGGNAVQQGVGNRTAGD